MARLLEVENLETQFKTESGIVKAVNGVSYYIDEQEIVGLVGESGCGKSVSQLSTMQLINPPGKIIGGKILFEGQDLLKFHANDPLMRSVRGAKIAMIFQEPMTSLNPVLTIGQQLQEMLTLHLKLNEEDAHKRAVELMGMVGIPSAEERVNDYPHTFSGGMRQRVMIAMGLSCNPKILIADEPTTALDVTTQAQLLELMKEMVERFHTSLVIVTHNLGVVARYAQRIYIMYAGKIVESGTTDDIFDNPRHPYTIGLLNCVPRLDEEEGRKLVPIHGLPPNLMNMPRTCAFLPRCSWKFEKCEKEPWPELTAVGENHFIRCYADTGEKKHASKVFSVGQPAAVVSAAPKKEDILLDVSELKMYFPVTRGLLRHKIADVKAVDNVSFQLQKHETLGLVGESGCGKTTVGRCILGLYRPTSGKMIFQNEDICCMKEKQLRAMRGKMALIFQDPYSSLDPRQSAGSIVGEPLLVHRTYHKRGEFNDRVNELFSIVGLDPAMKGRFPHEFSGGQRQRIGVARALACDPSLIVCDEPISALDVSIQAQIINLLEELQEKNNDLSYLFIAHDLSVVRHISDRVAVMYLGRIMEICRSRELYENPLHPYTRALLSAVPIADPFVEKTRERIILKGEVPTPLNPPVGCAFHPRCFMAVPECSQAVPPLRNITPDHQVACIKV